MSVAVDYICSLNIGNEKKTQRKYTFICLQTEQLVTDIVDHADSIDQEV